MSKKEAEFVMVKGKRLTKDQGTQFTPGPIPSETSINPLLDKTWFPFIWPRRSRLNENGLPVKESAATGSNLRPNLDLSTEDPTDSRSNYKFNMFVRRRNMLQPLNITPWPGRSQGPAQIQLMLDIGSRHNGYLHSEISELFERPHKPAASKHANNQTTVTKPNQSQAQPLLPIQFQLQLPPRRSRSLPKGRPMPKLSGRRPRGCNFVSEREWLAELKAKRDCVIIQHIGELLDKKMAHHPADSRLLHSKKRIATGCGDKQALSLSLNTRNISELVKANRSARDVRMSVNFLRLNFRKPEPSPIAVVQSTNQASVVHQCENRQRQSRNHPSVSFSQQEAEPVLNVAPPANHWKPLSAISSSSSSSNESSVILLPRIAS